MKMFIVFAAIIAVVLAAPAEDKDTVVLRNDNDNVHLDGYNFA